MRSAEASSRNDAGSWPRLSAVSAALIRSGRPVWVQIVRQEAVHREIGGVDAAEQEADPPDQRIAEVRHPAPAGRGRRRQRARAARAPKMIAAMIATGTAQNTKSHCQLCRSIGSTSGMVSAAGRISPIEQSVGVDRGGKADALRHPGANQRRQRRLHHRDAERRDDGAEIEHRDVRPDAAQRRADRAQQRARSAARSARRAARSSASRRWRRPRTAPSAGRTGCRPAFPTGAGRHGSAE